MKKDKKTIIFFLILIPVILLNIPQVSYKLKGMYVDSLSVPLRSTNLFFQSIKDFWFRISADSQYIFEENKKLNKEVDFLKMGINKYKEFEYENQRLKELLDFKEKLNVTSIPAQVIGKDLSAWRKSIIINKGEDDGIKINFLVVSSYGVVGKIFETGKNASKVMLLTDVDFKISAMVEYSREEGIIEGTGSETCVMKYVSKDGFVNKNDILISSGLGGVFPKGIIIGGVMSVGVAGDNIFKKIEVVPAVNFSKLEEVLVIVPEEKL